MWLKVATEFSAAAVSITISRLDKNKNDCATGSCCLPVLGLSSELARAMQARLIPAAIAW